MIEIVGPGQGVASEAWVASISAAQRSPAPLHIALVPPGRHQEGQVRERLSGCCRMRASTSFAGAKAGSVD